MYLLGLAGHKAVAVQQAPILQSGIVIYWAGFSSTGLLLQSHQYLPDPRCWLPSLPPYAISIFTVVGYFHCLSRLRVMRSKALASFRLSCLDVQYSKQRTTALSWLKCYILLVP